MSVIENQWMNYSNPSTVKPDNKNSKTLLLKEILFLHMQSMYHKPMVLKSPSRTAVFY